MSQAARSIASAILMQSCAPAWLTAAFGAFADLEPEYGSNESKRERSTTLSEQPEYTPPTSPYAPVPDYGQVPPAAPGGWSTPTLQYSQYSPAPGYQYPGYQDGAPYTQYGAPYAPVPPAAQAPRRSRRRAVAIGTASVVALGVVGGVAFVAGRDFATPGQRIAFSPVGHLAAGDEQRRHWVGGSGSGGYDPSGGSGGYGSGGWSGGYDPSGGSGSGSGSSGGATATSAQSVGVVDINTVLKYQGAQAAGTGMVLTSSGVILTNNHVIDGATSISVTVVSTGASYTATVVGDDPTQDVAVLQLQNASGLKTAKLGDSNGVSVGEAVTGVGNAGGVGGTPSAAAGTVTALNQPITASDESGQNVQHLTGMIETNAGIQAGDSGGPLYDSKELIGMDSAASAGAAGTTAYAIPIDHAEQIAEQIASGKASDTVHLGYPAFLGISIADASVQGAAVAVRSRRRPGAGRGHHPG